MALLRRAYFSSMTVQNHNISILALKRTFPLLHRRSTTESSVSAETSKFESVVGLVVHAQINSNSELFSSSPVMFGLPTNKTVLYFDAAFPGNLHILKRCCIEAGMLTALACNSTLHNVSADLKNFYLDLPDDCQTSLQFQHLSSNGYIKFIVPNKENENYSYQCTSILKHLKVKYDYIRNFQAKGNKNFINLNRIGIGMMEFVFEQNMKNGLEAAALVKELICILKRLDTCSCEIEEGTLCVDANISVNRIGHSLDIRTKVKNISSLKFIERDIDFEIKRQIEILKDGNLDMIETQASDNNTKNTAFFQGKEVLQDCHNRTESNNFPVQICDKINFANCDNNVDIDDLRKKLPILPEAERSNLLEVYQLPLQIADKLVNSDGLSEVFELAASSIDDKSIIYSFLLNNIQHRLNARKLSFKTCGLSVQQITDIIKLLHSHKISIQTADDILEMLFNGDQRSVEEIIRTYNWYLICVEAELEKMCRKVLVTHSKVAKKYRKSRRKHYMSTLLIALNEKVSRASLTHAEEVFQKLIQNQIKKNQI